jgi:hypothetical protein
MPSPRQAVIGCGRVSTEEQESNYSMDSQRTRFEALTKQNRWQSLGFFPETGSGTNENGEYDRSRAAKYTCPGKPACSQKRMLIEETFPVADSS